MCVSMSGCAWGGGVLKFVALPRSLQQTGLADAVAAVVASSLVDPTFEPGHLVSQMWADPCQGEVVRGDCFVAVFAGF